MPETILRLVSRNAYEAPAELLATLAFSGLAEENKRRTAADQLSAQMLRMSYNSFASGRDLARAQEHHIALAEEQKTLAPRVEQRLQARQRAAAVAAPLIDQHRGLEVHVRGARRVSLRGLTDRAVELGWNEDRSDFISRTWRPSLSVLHMAVALQATLRERAHFGIATNHMDFFLNPVVVMRAVELARPLEAVVQQLWAGAEDQWRFRLAA